MVNFSTENLAAKSKRMSVTIKEHLVAGGNNVYDPSGEAPMRTSNASINRAALEARRVSTGPMALSMKNFLLNNISYKTLDNSVTLPFMMQLNTTLILFSDVFVCNLESIIHNVEY